MGTSSKKRRGKERDFTNTEPHNISVSAFQTVCLSAYVILTTTIINRKWKHRKVKSYAQIHSKTEGNQN